ncbi:MAG: AAA domain-containing protein [Proteobacteria bacterium]|nr:AAA domain-containing protein [Pseudomonadota bacterium]
MTDAIEVSADQTGDGDTIRQRITRIMVALEKSDHPGALKCLNRSLALLSSLAEQAKSDSGDPEITAFIMASTLKLSNCCLLFGQQFRDLPGLLETALNLSVKCGDERSQALMKLHQGRGLYFAGKDSEALARLSRGLEEARNLGDADILSRTSPFFGLYYLIQGEFKEALGYFEQAIQVFETQDDAELADPYLPIFLGYCSTYLGQFHRAIGSLDCNWRLALERPYQTVATTIRAVLGTVLLVAGKKQVATFHLKHARQEAEDTNNAFALYLANQGMAFQHFVKGQLEKAHQILGRNFEKGGKLGIIPKFFSPWVLEMVFEFERQGMMPISGFEFKQRVAGIMKSPNIQLQGIALRLQAKNSNQQEPELISARLAESEKLLKQSGDPLQLARTVLEMARVRLDEGNRESARLLAHKAWLSLAGYGEEFFPDDLRNLLGDSAFQFEDRTAREEFLKQSLEITENFVPGEDLEESLIKIVSACNRMLGAERGGLFRLRTDSRNHAPELWAASNLTKSEVDSDDFRPSLSIIKRAFSEKAPQVIRPDFPIYRSAGHQARAVLCLPIELDGEPAAILYHDNSYFNDCFDRLDDDLKRQIAARVNLSLQRTLHFGRLEVAKDQLNSVKSLQMDRFQQDAFITENRRIEKLLVHVDQVAATDSAVLFMGETGVGKELMARRLYQMSPRYPDPFVVVDLTSIPESLLESELFGHEKGAFTGAIQQKKGRIELARQGTLFIDELGEIPRTIQVKLLRVLQEKTYMRVGGTTTLSSDFRLITATNRDLEEEVAAGNFREDLYYRISVVPFIIPPLRERDDDAILLARHFLERYTKKYNRRQIRLSPQDEAMIKAYHWPGNVRELKNVIERAVILSTDNKLEIDLSPGLDLSSRNPFTDFPSMDEIQRRYIRFVLEKTGNRIDGDGGAAQLLGMKRTTLYARMKKLSLR